ncbi:acyltransferase family protein [Achromobacter sp. UBA4530]|uniref:acyltransferase family protein n=1 Tax=Achromobacter sp. UBA4530 TaxID=1945912 RepID=UPI00258100F9|nr:acyltransferase [Achromobacter sp. UBA4530]
MTTPGRYPGIDVLRAIAVSLVVLFHANAIRIGWVGVDLFFVLSGFLIGGMLLEKIGAGKLSMWEFYSRRALRILPIYYFMILMYYFFKAGAPALDWPAIRNMLYGGLFLQTTGPYFFPNLIRVDPQFIVDGSWSLVIEEMFYLIAPLALVLAFKVTKNNLKNVTLIVFLVALAGMAARLWVTFDYAPNDGRYFGTFIQFHMRFDELAAGVVAAGIVLQGWNVRRWSAVLLATSAALWCLFGAFMLANPAFLAAPYTITDATVWLPTLFGAAGALALLAVYWWPCRSKLVVFIARLSYPLYLVHLLVFQVVKRYRGTGFWAAIDSHFGAFGVFTLMIGVSVVLAYAVSLLVEFPFLRAYKGRRPALANHSPGFAASTK